MERLCCDLNPILMLEYFEQHAQDLPALAITEYWYNNPTFLLSVIKARALQWKKHQRGLMQREEGGLLRAQFGPVLTQAEESFLLKMNPYHRDFKEPEIINERDP